MICCSEECAQLPCCDFCIHCVREYFESDDLLTSIPFECALHPDKEHQEIVDSCWYCEDFHCKNAKKPEKWIEV